MTDKTVSSSLQTVPVFAASAFVACDGVAEGDAISFADELVMDDSYQLGENPERRLLSIARSETGGHFSVAQNSATGQPGNLLVLDSCLTLMAPDSTTYEALVLVEVEAEEVANIWFLPLANLTPETAYRLVGVDRDVAHSRFAEMACVSFTRGTHITLASGQQRCIEDLQVGDKVLTRDDGAQAIRWIGQMTLRAVGEFAPVVIRKGVLHNENDLVVSPDHRLFIYQRTDRIGAGRSEVLVKVRHLIDGEQIYQQDGGFVDYFQLLFDEHHFIFAEGIAAETVLIDPRTRAALPANVTKGDHSTRAHADFEVQERLLKKPGALELLKRASSSRD